MTSKYFPLTRSTAPSRAFYADTEQARGFESSAAFYAVKDPARAAACASAAKLIWARIAAARAAI